MKGKIKLILTENYAEQRLIFQLYIKIKTRLSKSALCSCKKNNSRHNNSILDKASKVFLPLSFFVYFLKNCLTHLLIYIS